MKNFICLTYNVEKIGNLESYIKAPITYEGNPIGYISHAEELSDSYLITAYLWDKKFKAFGEYFYNGDLASMEIKIQ